MTFNDWFLNLSPERQAIIREDKWMLANAAFEAGKEAEREVVYQACLNGLTEGLEVADPIMQKARHVGFSDFVLNYAKTHADTGTSWFSKLTSLINFNKFKQNSLL